jgi:phosphonate transport system substrate-binding protein
VRKLVESPTEVDAAVSSWVFSGPYDLVGDGRKQLEAERPGTLADTRIIFKTEEPAAERASSYYGSVYTRVDSGITRLSDLNGKRYAFSDETSTSGHIFPRLLLDRHGVSLGRVYYAGGHPNVVQAVWDGKADAGSAYYVPPGEREKRNGTFVGDARTILLSRMKPEDRLGFLDEVRIIALTDPIPNDVCVVRRGFPEETWQTFADSLQRFLVTDGGRVALFDLVAGIAATPTEDSAFDGFRQALEASGMSAAGLLEAEEEKLEQRRRQEESE